MGKGEVEAGERAVAGDREGVGEGTLRSQGSGDRRGKRWVGRSGRGGTQRIPNPRGTRHPAHSGTIPESRTGSRLAVPGSGLLPTPPAQPRDPDRGSEEPARALRPLVEFQRQRPAPAPGISQLCPAPSLDFGVCVCVCVCVCACACVSERERGERRFVFLRNDDLGLSFPLCGCVLTVTESRASAWWGLFRFGLLFFL